MLTPFVLFFGLSVATAAIAYWSDNLGKKLGKKRVSILGLRPRTTATVLTIASSWGIMLFTLLVMLVVARPLRDALFQYDSLRAQQEGLRLENQRSEAALSQKERQVLAAENRARLSQGAAEAARRSENAARRAQNFALRDAQSAQHNARAAQKGEKAAVRRAQLAAQTARNAATRAQTAARNAQLAARRARRAQDDLLLNQRRLQEADARLRQTDADLEGAQKRLQLAATRVQLAQRELQNAQRAAQDARLGEKNAKSSATRAFQNAATAIQNAAAAAREEATAQARVTELLAQREDLQGRVASLSREADELQLRVTGLGEAVTQLSTLPVLVSAGQTVVARTLPPELSAERIESHLRSLLKVARASGGNGEKLLPGARVELWSPVVGTLGRGGIQLLSSDQQDALIASAAAFVAGRGENSVRLVAVRNFIESEDVLWVRFLVVPVRPALAKGQLLASISIDGRAGDAALFNALLTMIETGRVTATRSGANPPQSPDDPNFYENGTNELIFGALREIQKTGKTVTVRLLAADDVSSVEPVRVRFEVGA